MTGPPFPLLAFWIAMVISLSWWLAAASVAAPILKGPRPGERVETAVSSTALDRNLISESYVRLYEPLPRSLGAPAACDWVGYLRFRDRQGPSNASRADAILVAMPGFLGGASLFDGLARDVIRKAAAHRRYFEFWALDRRANCLEDHIGIDAAARARDFRVALDYYYRSKSVDGYRFAGFKTSAQVPYLAEFGLAQTMRDEYAVVTQGIPNPIVRGRKLFCGGHSLGGSLTGAFASWNFPDGDEPPGQTDVDDAGYKQCAGFFGLDTQVTNNLGGGAKTGGLKGDALYAAETTGIRSGALPRLAAASLPILNPEMFEVTGIAALAAFQEPNGAALLGDLPRSSNIDLALRFLLSRNAVAFATGIPDPRAYRLTNEALLGTIFDDNAEPIAGLQASLGTYDGGSVVEKHFPLPGTPLADVPGLGPTVNSLLADTIVTPGGSISKLMIPATPGGPLYRWRNYAQVSAVEAAKQLDSLGKPFTSPASEVTDMHQFARLLYGGPTDAWEQYFPMRLLADDGAFLSGARTGDLRAVRYENGPGLRPYLELIAGQGVATDATYTPIEPGVGPRQRVVLPGYNHLDVATAAYRQNGGGPEGSSEALTSFVLQVIGLPVHRTACRTPSKQPRPRRHSVSGRRKSRHRARPACPQSQMR